MSGWVYLIAAIQAKAGSEGRELTACQDSVLISRTPSDSAYPTPRIELLLV
jgi:hypothetical protein